MFKKLIIGLGLVVVVLAVGIYYVSQNAGAFIKAAIEDQGSRATAVAVKVDGVDLSLTDLKAGIRGLTVGNPSGFETARAVSLGEVSVKINKDWSTNLIVIDEIMIRAPEITYEIGSSGSNIAAIQQNVENFMKVMGGGSSDSGSAPSDSAAGPKVVISDLYIKGGKINVSASLFKGKTLTTPLPEIHLTDIGKDTGGASPAEVVDQIISAITESSSGAAGSLDLTSLGLSDISGKAAEIGGAAAEAVGGALEGAMGGAGDAGDAAKDAMEGAAENVGGALKGLFGN